MDRSCSIDSVISTFQGLLREKRQSCTIGKANWRTPIPIMRSISDGCLRFMILAEFNLVVYRFFPLPLALPHAFPWGWKVSALIAAMIAIPSGYLMFRGLRDAGEETLRPRKEHGMYGGIYQSIRHPQAVGEFPFWWVISFLVDSRFLVLFSFLYIPVWYYICCAEEKDLLIRYGDSYAGYMKRVGFLVPKAVSP